MRLLILSMPAVAFIAVLSVSFQHAVAVSDRQEALPEATRIYEKVMGEHAHAVPQQYRPTAKRDAVDFDNQ